ncbi:MAG: hypothetical protein IPM98_00790 [Lewinellaceae bacterium]|nr:hypothetical protein [Lewinellaceae bacterium]
MEKHSDIQVRMIRILEVVERANKAIAFHKSFKESDDLAIKQYQKLKEQASKDLFELLAELGVSPPQEVAA